MTHLYDQIKSIAETKYKDIVTGVKTLGKRTIGSSKLRLFIKDGSFLDIWLSGTGKYSFHWEERAQRGLIHRYDNAPDYPAIETHPKHFHDGDEKNVKSSFLNDRIEISICQVLDFVKEKLQQYALEEK